MVGVIIGVDPHKGSHTAVALDASEHKLGQLRVRATPAQVEQLRRWAAAWPQRSWAIEGAGGLGHLLAQQLIAAGERVVDVQPKLAARMRLLNTGAVNKNDLSRLRNRVACRLHAVLRDLVPGGFATEISAAQAAKVVAHIVADEGVARGAADAARLELAAELLEGLRGIDEQRRAVKRRLGAIAAASTTSLTEVYGVGPVIAATVLGYVGEISRFPQP